MSDSPLTQSLELAEAAAAAGDFPAAARHLRALADAQEVQLGSRHPDLANTLNNLAIVAERAGDLDTAESAFRRSSAIAGSTFEASHPLVITSTRNLREFCEAHGRPYDEPALPLTPVVTDVLVAASPAGARSWSALVLAGVVAGLIAAAAVVWFVSRRTSNPPEAAPVAETRRMPSAPAKLEPTDATQKSQPPATPAVTAAAAGPATETSPSPISVVNATVCRDFSTEGGEWRCTPVEGSASVGPLVFYTRLKTTQPTTVEHRWYRGDTLYQRVSLRIAANTGAGYRTFSRNTVGADRAGAWRVELRDANDVVVHEQTFVVQ